LLGLSAVFVYQTFHLDPVQLVAQFFTLTFPQQLTIVVAVLVTSFLIASAALQSARFARQGRRLASLNKRLNAFREASETVDGAQRNLSSAVDHLVASDPENTIVSLHQRLIDAEQRTATQQGRNEAVDMQARLDEIRRRQQALREQLGEVAEQRRAIAPVFDELRERQIQLDRALAEVETDSSSTSLPDRLKGLTDNVTQFNARLKGLEESLTTLHRFRDELGQSRDRIEPLRAPDVGIAALMTELQARHGELNTALDAIELRDGEKLAVRVEALMRGKQDTEQRLARLVESSTQLDEIRRSFDDLKERGLLLDHALTEIERNVEGKTLVERQNELNEFTSQSRARLLTLENALLLLGRFREDMDKYQTEIVPLQSPVSGIEAVIADLIGRRDRLVRSLDELERHGDEKLGDRVEAIYRSKLDTEQRIAAAMANVARLDSIRKEVDGLFVKLSTTIQRLG
jgi:chromosome segregation ATPase